MFDTFRKSSVKRFKVSELDVRRQTSSREFQRGQDYYRKGHVVQLEQQASMIVAHVAGSRSLPYRVRVAFHEGELAYGTCDCSHRRRGWCKHIVATMVAYMSDQYRPKEKETATLNVVLDDLDAGTLKSILIQLAQKNPSVVKDIKDHLSGLGLLPEGAEHMRVEQQDNLSVSASGITDFFDSLGSGWNMVTDFEPFD